MEKWYDSGRTIIEAITSEQDVIDYLRVAADSLSRISVPSDELLAYPFPHEKELRVLAMAACILMHGMENDLMMKVPRIDFSSPWQFYETVSETAIVWAHAMKAKEMPPFGCRERAAWSLSKIAEGLWRKQGTIIRDLVRQRRDRTAGGTRQRAGRKPMYDKKLEAKLYDDFKSAGGTVKEFASARGLRAAEVNAIFRRVRARKSRTRNNVKQRFD